MKQEEIKPFTKQMETGRTVGTKQRTCAIFLIAFYFQKNRKRIPFMANG
jgi:hypothetical protein